MVIAWRLYYADGSTFSNDNGTWAQAPDGIQVLTFHNGYGWNLSHGVDTYELPGHTIVKHGEWTDDENYTAILERAYEDVR